MKFFSLAMLLSIAPFVGALENISQETIAHNNNQEKSSVNAVGRPLTSKDLSASSRFKEIKMQDPAEEIAFWSHQLSEHALFLHLGMEDPAFKQRGMDLHKKFEQFRNSMSEETFNQVLPLAQQLRAYKMDVLKALNSGKWIGWIFPSMVEHIIRELDYFVDKLNDVPYSITDEINFWDHTNADHAALEAHLFDPSEHKLAMKAVALAQKMYTLPENEIEMYIHLSLRATKELDTFNKTGRSLSKAHKLKSIIHPVLMDHVIREGERSQRVLRELQKMVQSSHGKRMSESSSAEESQQEQNRE